MAENLNIGLLFLLLVMRVVRSVADCSNKFLELARKTTENLCPEANGKMLVEYGSVVSELFL
jgi:hypothetical protein